MGIDTRWDRFCLLLRRTPVKRAVRAVGVVVGHVLRKHPFQVRTVEDYVLLKASR